MNDAIRMPVRIGNYSFAIPRAVGFLATLLVEVGFVVLVCDPDMDSPLMAAAVLCAWGAFVVWVAAVLIRAPWWVVISEEGIRVRWLLSRRDFTWDQIADVALDRHTTYVDQGMILPLEIPFRRYAVLRFSLRGRRGVTVFLSKKEAQAFSAADFPMSHLG